MKVLFIGSGKKPSTFIQRRIDSLREINVTCFLPLENEVHKRNYAMYLLKIMLFHPKRFHFFIKIYRAQKGIDFKLKIKRAIKYIDFIENVPDIIHFQWISHVNSFEWLINYFKKTVIASVRGSMVTVYPNNNPTYKKLLSKSFALTDHVHCVSDSLKSICIDEFNITKEKVFTNYNGIDTQKFKPSKGKEEQRMPFTLISVGALMWRKGFLLQLLILKELQNYPIKLICIGKGEDEFKLQYQAKKLGLLDRIEFVGEKTEDEIISYLQQSSVYISTSIAEGLSNSVLEAAACGLPTIAFECEGMNEVILNDMTGFVVPFGDVKEMATKIIALKDDEETLKKFGKQARDHVLENFKIEEHVKKMTYFYKELIK